MTITAIRNQSQAMRHSVHVRDHIISAYASVEEGGGDAGPSPHDSYDAALPACKALMLLWYAKHKGLRLENVEVSTERVASAWSKGVQRLAAAGKCARHTLITDVSSEVTMVLA